MKLAFIDLETTGLDPHKHGIWSIGAILEVDSQIVKTLDLRCRPIQGIDHLSCKALEIGRITVEELNALPDASTTKTELLAVLGKYIDPQDRADQFHLIGYNAQFDYSFLRAWFEKLGDEHFPRWFWHPPIDVMNLCALYSMYGREHVNSFKLARIAKQLAGIDAEKTHDALADIQTTRDLFYFLKREAYAAWKVDPPKKRKGE